MKIKKQSEQLETKLKDQLEAKLKEQSEQLECKLNEHSGKQSEQFQEAVREISEYQKVYTKYGHVKHTIL